MALIYVVEDDEPIRRELADILARAVLRLRHANRLSMSRAIFSPPRPT